jgi:hypothetical protein
MNGSDNHFSFRRPDLVDLVNLLGIFIGTRKSRLIKFVY